MCKRKSVVICLICEACSFDKVENVIYEYIKENWTKNWTLWHALNGGFPVMPHFPIEYIQNEAQVELLIFLKKHAPTLGALKVNIC